jgi:hypothetical protein
LTQPITAANSVNQQYRESGGFEHGNPGVTETDNTERQEVPETVCAERSEVPETQL